AVAASPNGYLGLLVLLLSSPLSRLLNRIVQRRHGIAGDFAAIVLFAIALVIAVAASPNGYLGLLVLLLSSPLSRLLNRIVQRRHRDSHPATPE
ncbi:hypothetical protein CTI14_28840, partial [Methylobacterium radiotolerans]